MIANFLKSTSIDKEPEQPSSSHFHTISQPDSSQPTSNNFLAPTTWKLLLHDLERQVAHSDVLLPKTHLQPRDEGAFLFWEHSDWFQSVSRSCVDAAADPFTVHGLFCSAVIDFGMSIMIAAKTVQDSAICAVMGQVSGDELLCLSWMVFRTAFPGVLPDFFDADLPYSKQRNIPK
ncbi:uncharacterized protein LOC131886603 isoform X2 [Tigriopus californicus]|uniref:uncharacterized protein LOC131886603 isoform X2 n=1 Tax=Tigriopus californicus TaxID=6832 RepID=UPI0027DA48D2|nr:uncharacterized protein LOC131886603 isoform X2 [Tigriopus californicus]